MGFQLSSAFELPSPSPLICWSMFNPGSSSFWTHRSTEWWWTPLLCVGNRTIRRNRTNHRFGGIGLFGGIVLFSGINISGVPLMVFGSRCFSTENHNQYCIGCPRNAFTASRLVLYMFPLQCWYHWRELFHWRDQWLCFDYWSVYRDFSDDSGGKPILP